MTRSEIINAEAIREVKAELERLYHEDDEGSTALGITWDFTVRSADINKQIRDANFKLARLEGRL